MISFAVNSFALWLILGVAWAWVAPAHFTWFIPHISPGLGIIMFGMGITLHPSDFREPLTRPFAPGVGVVAQFLIMPLLGWVVAKVFALESPLAVGLILVACCPGGTASNVITHIARANVPLSVVMTAVSTLAAVILTPLLTQFYAGAYVPVPVGAMLADMAMVVLLPVGLGLLVSFFFPRIARGVGRVSPLLSVLLIVLIVGAIVGARRDAIYGAGLRLVAAVVTLHLLGFLCGYLFAKLFRRPEPDCRTISIEVGMQNSGLGAKLAAAHFANPLTAVPSAISAVVHSLIGSCAAAFWRREKRGKN